MVEIPDEIKTNIDSLISDMKSGEFFGNYAKVTFPKYKCPSNSWSGWNKILIAMRNDWDKNPYNDWRGFNQWKEAGRHVKKGAKADAILVPMMSKTRYYSNDEGKIVILKKGETAPEGTEESERSYPRGFKAVPVFPYDSTAGKKIKYPILKLPKLNYLEVAKALGVSVSAIAGNDDFYGYYNPSKKQIKLATPDTSTFYHELVHLVDDHLDKKSGGKGLKGGQDADQETVAQISAGVLARLNGENIKAVTGYTKGYVERYQGAGEEGYKKVMILMTRIEKIISYITNFGKTETPEVKAEKAKGEKLSPVEKQADTDADKEQLKNLGKKMTPSEIEDKAKKDKIAVEKERNEKV